MRRQLLRALPLLMSTYPSFRPWDVYRFTSDELSVLLKAAQEGPEHG